MMPLPRSSAGLLGDKYVNIDAGGGGDLLEPGGTIRRPNRLDFMELISKWFGIAIEGRKRG